MRRQCSLGFTRNARMQQKYNAGTHIFVSKECKIFLDGKTQKLPLFFSRFYICFFYSYFSFKCVFTVGGGFHLGSYQCCCRGSPASLSYCHNGSLVEQSRKLNRRFKWHCPNVVFNNNLMDSNISNNQHIFIDPLCNNGSYTKLQYEARCASSATDVASELADGDVDNTLRKVLLSINVICAICAFVLIFVAMTHRKTQVRVENL